MSYKLCEKCEVNFINEYGERLCEKCKREEAIAEKYEYNAFAKTSDITVHSTMKNGKICISTRKDIQKAVSSNNVKPIKKKKKKQFVPYNNIAHPYQGGGCSGK